MFVFLINSNVTFHGTLNVILINTVLLNIFQTPQNFDLFLNTEFIIFTYLADNLTYYSSTVLFMCTFSLLSLSENTLDIVLPQYFVFFPFFLSTLASVLSSFLPFFFIPFLNFGNGSIIGICKNYKSQAIFLWYQEI